MSRLVRTLSAILAAVFIMTMISSVALAADYSSVKGIAKVKYYILTVKTGSGLLPGKVSFGFYKGIGNDAETGIAKSVYGDWRIQVYDSSGKLVNTKHSFGYSGVTITGLKRNSTYTLYVYGPIAPRNTLVEYHIKQWSVYPMFYIKSTRNISNMWISGRSVN